MIKPFEQHLLFELTNSIVADISRKENLDYHAVDNLIGRYIETEIDFSTIEALGLLGLDEISIKKGYRDFVTLTTYRFADKVGEVQTKVTLVTCYNLDITQLISI